LSLTLSKKLRKIQNQLHGLDYAYFHQQLTEKLGHLKNSNYLTRSLKVKEYLNKDAWIPILD
jgi:hypothetical protein